MIYPEGKNSMENKKIIERQTLTGERALFASKGIKVVDSVFCDGESPLKESSDVELENCLLRWKYPLWYCSNVKAVRTTWFEMARAGVWYSDNVDVLDCVIEAPKNFRRCDGLTLTNVFFPNAEETLWHCKNVRLNNVTAKGNYFAMNTENIEIDGFTLDGNYSFDGGRNIKVSNARMLSKDSFWNCENVCVKDSFITGEYLGWNSKNLVLENCTIESLQGLCYIEGLKLINCRLINTTLCFEYSSVEADVKGDITSVFNPKEGRITADSIGLLILEKDKIDPGKTKIVCSDIKETTDVPRF